MISFHQCRTRHAPSEQAPCSQDAHDSPCMSTYSGVDHVLTLVSLTRSGTRTHAARSASNKLIRFHCPVDPPCWPSLPPVTRQNLDVLSARWDNVWDNRLHGLLFIAANTKLCAWGRYLSTCAANLSVQSLKVRGAVCALHIKHAQSFRPDPCSGQPASARGRVFCPSPPLALVWPCSRSSSCIVSLPDALSAL